MKQLPSHCLCEKPLNVEHALSCPTGGFPIIHHNEIRDITARMTKVCHSLSVEPLLQPLTGEQLSTKSAVTTDEARADIQARGFWGDRKQQAFFGVKVFNPYAKTYHDTPLANCYRKCEMKKKRSCEEHIREVEPGSYTPLIFSTQGGMSIVTTTMYKRLASLIFTKKSQPYSKAMNWIRCLIRFALLRAPILCLRGACSSANQAAMLLITRWTSQSARGRFNLLNN